MEKPKLKRDWAGRHVRLLRKQTTNGGDTFAPGMIMRVSRYYRGLELAYVSACKTCRLKHRHVVSRVQEYDIELLAEDDPAVLTRSETLESV